MGLQETIVDLRARNERLRIENAALRARRARLEAVVKIMRDGAATIADALEALEEVTP